MDLRVGGRRFIILRHVDGEPLGEIGDGGLGGGIPDDLGQRPERVHRRSVDDGAGPCLGEELAEHLGREHGSDDVELEDEADRVGGKVEEGERVGGGGLLFVSAGAVDKGVDAAEPAHHFVACGFETGFVEDVGLYGDGSAAIFADVVGDGLCGGLGEVEDCDAGAKAGEAPRHLAAEDSPAARNDDAFVLDPEEFFQCFRHRVLPVLSRGKRG